MENIVFQGDRNKDCNLNFFPTRQIRRVAPGLYLTPIITNHMPLQKKKKKFRTAEIKIRICDQNVQAPINIIIV